MTRLDLLRRLYDREPDDSAIKQLLRVAEAAKDVVHVYGRSALYDLAMDRVEMALAPLLVDAPGALAEMGSAMLAAVSRGEIKTSDE